MVQSIWLRMDDVTPGQVLSTLIGLYEIRSLKTDDNVLATRWTVQFHDDSYVRDFLESRRIVQPGAVCMHGDDVLDLFMDWYALEIREGKEFPGVSLGRDIFQMHCLDYYDRLKTLGYALRFVQGDLQKEGIESTLDMGDAETHIKRAVMHYKI